MTDNQEQLIQEAVEKALQGDMDAVNNIEDRVTRSKAKAALVKAKREAAKTSAEPSSEDKSEALQNQNRRLYLLIKKLLELLPANSLEPLMKNHHQKRIYNCNRQSGLMLPNICAMIQPVYLIRCNVLLEWTWVKNLSWKFGITCIP